MIITVEHLIPFYSSNEKTFLLYRVPHKKTISYARQLDNMKFSMKDGGGVNECSYAGRVHVHTINFELLSCTCRWFLAFNVFSHLVAACDHYNYQLSGYTKPKAFVYRSRRGPKKKTMSITEAAFRSNPMPLIDIPARREDLFINEDMRLPELNPRYVSETPEFTQPEPEPVRITRSEKKISIQPEPVRTTVSQKNLKR